MRRKLRLFKRFITVTLQKKNQELISISGFKISFTIEKVSSSDPNTCSVSIYNLTKDTRNKLNEEKALLTVKAGYESENNQEVIFVGDVNLVKNKVDNSDIITTIEARDGDEPLLTTRDSISFKEGVSVKQILKSIIGKFKIGVKTNLDLTNFANKTYQNGFSFMGELRGLLDKIATDSGLTWSVQNNELKFYGDTAVDKSLQIIINKETGLIGIPERIKFKKTKETTEKEVSGWSVVTLLQPKAEPGGWALISSNEIGENKEFKIEKVSHTADNFEGDFLTTLEVTEIGK